MTPQEAATIANQGLTPTDARKKDLEDFISTESPRNIQLFIHNLDNSGRPVYFNLARTELDIRFSEQQAKSAETLEHYTRWLIGFTLALVILTIFLCVDSYFSHHNTGCENNPVTRNSK
jgi:hypothetical protein